MATREQFATDWLNGLGAPIYDGALTALVNLIATESDKSEPWSNPDYAQGVRAAVELMQTAEHTEALAALHARFSAQVVTAALASSWPAVAESLAGTMQDYRTISQVEVAGAVEEPVPVPAPVVEEPVPFEPVPAPVEEPAPVVEEPAPAPVEPAPVVEEPASIDVTQKWWQVSAKVAEVKAKLAELEELIK